MPTRRCALAFAGGALAALTGCLQGPTGTAGTDNATDTPADSPTSTPPPAGTSTVAGTDRTTRTDDRPDAAPDRVTRVDGDLPEWTPSQWVDVGYENVLGIDAVGSRLYVTMGDERGDSAVAALSPGRDSFDWRQSCAGEAEAGTQATPVDANDNWGVTVADGTVYSVHGRGDSSEWTTLHALDASTGRRRWRFERERGLGVVGFLDDSVLVRATEFFEPDHSHDTPEGPLETTVYAVDRASASARWSVSAAPLAATAVGSDAVYVASGRTVTAYAPGGERRWTSRAGDTVRLMTVVDGTVVLSVGPGPEGSSLVGLSTAGETRWRVPLGTRALVPHDGRVYVADESVAAVAADGNVAWQTPAHGHELLPAGDRLYTRTDVRMNAVDAYTLPGGKRAFRFVTPSNNGWPLAATADTLVAEAITPDEADFTSLFAVDASTGNPRGVYRPTDTVFTATGFDGAVYAGFGGGRLGVFSSR